LTSYEEIDNFIKMKDYRTHHECEGINPDIGWVLAPASYKPIGSIPIQVQGFLGAYRDRDQDYWCPEAGFTVSKEYFHRPFKKVLEEAQRQLKEEQSLLYQRKNVLRELSHDQKLDLLKASGSSAPLSRTLFTKR
jgi:hypothetical protein